MTQKTKRGIDHLQAYLWDNKIPQRQFAVAMCVHEVTLCRILKRKQDLTVAKAKKIEHITGGKVKASDLLDISPTEEPDEVTATDPIP